MESISDQNPKSTRSFIEKSAHSLAPQNLIANQLTAIYVFVDHFLKANPAIANWRRSNNLHPAFSDAEVITIALMQGVFGCATLKKTH